MIQAFKGNVWGSWEIKGGLDWVKTRCLVILIYFKTPENYITVENLGGISARAEEFLGGISAGKEEFLKVSRPGRKSFWRYFGRNGTA